MRANLLVALVLVISSPALAARESKADRRLGLPAGTSRAFGRAFARNLALQALRPRSSWEDQHVGVRDQVRYQLSTGALRSLDRTSDGGFVAEIDGQAAREGYPLVVTRLVLPALRRDPRGGPHSLVVEATLRSEAIATEGTLSWSQTHSGVIFPAVRRAGGRIVPTTSDPHLTLMTTSNGADQKLVHMTTMARPGAATGLRQLWVENLDGSPDQDNWPSEVSQVPVNRGTP